MITHLRLFNFRSHGDTRISLKPITALIGPVGSGKSNLFKGIVLVQNTIHRTLVELFPPGLGEFQWVRSRWAEQTDPIGFQVEMEGLPSFPGELARYTLRIADSPSGLYVLEETLERQGVDSPLDWVFQRRAKKQAMGAFGQVDPYEPTLLFRVWHQDPQVNASAEGVRFSRDVAQQLSRVGYFHLEASRLKATGDGSQWERIQYDGRHLPDFFSWAKGNPEGVPVYQAILKDMRELRPDLDAIIVTQVRSDQQGLAMSFKEQCGFITAPDLSDGTMFTLGLLCIVHGPKRPALLCIEEPETGLHPRRLRWLFDKLLGLAYPPGTGVPPVQVLLSTHSPDLVDYFRDMQDSIQVVQQSQGRTQIASLPDIQNSKLHHPPNSEQPIGHMWASGLYEDL